MRLRKRRLAKEVIQTSAMDCGPASLKCLLEGFGISASYGRLREACQTNVDGTSIDKVEEAAVALGLDAEQVMAPVDHLNADLLPALVVARLPQNATHFLVVWSVHGPVLQLMDPAIGRRWVTRREFLDELYVHQMDVPADGWREFAASDGFLRPLRARLRETGVSPGDSERLIEAAASDPGWKGLAALDAAVRTVTGLIAARAVRRGPTACRLIERFCAAPESIPPQDWSATEGSAGHLVRMTGAVLIRVRGRRARGAPAEALPRELAAALEEQPSGPGLELLRRLRADGVLAPAVVAAAILLAAAGAVVEPLLLRGFFDIGGQLKLSGQRLWAMLALCVFLAGLALLEIPIASGLLRIGRRLELRLRLAFLRKIPRLEDRYFQSRLNSDMAERSHSVHLIRHAPELCHQLLHAACGIVLTAAGIAWIEPSSAKIAAAAALVALAVPLAAQPLLVERDLRFRSHLGALSRFYLDALLGLTAIRAHGAERVVRREHESLLREWSLAGMRLQRAIVTVEAMQLACGFGLAAWLLLDRLGQGGQPGGVLLLAYWALSLPLLGASAAQATWQYPAIRNVALRLLEPLGAPEAPGGEAPAAKRPKAAGAGIVFESVTVCAAGNNILDEIDLAIAPGSHVAIVGSSGAGKSSLVGVLLGWHRPARGRVLVDGEPLDVERLRADTAWVDPAVQLWNRSMLENLCYGMRADTALAVDRAVADAGLLGVLERMTDGFQTSLGEGGALVSGGEGQRVRMARAFLRTGVRLAILDEPARGLDRSARRDAVSRARLRWKDATLLCITHDVGETESFERVLVVEGGRIVEDGAPDELGSRPSSRYRELLAAERAVRRELWDSPEWRKLRLESGQLYEVSRGREIREASA